MRPQVSFGLHWSENKQKVHWIYPTEEHLNRGGVAWEGFRPFFPFSNQMIRFILGAPLKYMGPLIHNRIVPEGSSVDLSCELSDPSVQVTLWQMLRSGGMYTPKKNVVKWGQIFTLHRASKSIEGTYLCKSRQPRFTVGIGSVHVTPKPKGK